MLEYTNDELGIIFIDSFKELDYNSKSCIFSATKNYCQIIENFPKFEQIITKLTSKDVYNHMSTSLAHGQVVKLIKYFKDKNIKVITFISKNYPEEIKTINNPPIVLYAKGNIDLLAKENKFAIVGSRKTGALEFSKAEEISNKLADNNFVVVTGLAEGGDTAAIKGALKIGNIISVLAYGFDFIYPEVNRNLFKEITEKGLVITENIPSISPTPYLFPIRNRIIAGLSSGCLIISGSLKSGTLYTANYAREFDREVFAFPYAISDNKGAGCNALIKNGAKLTDSALDIFSYYGINFQEKAKEIKLNKNEAIICEILNDGERHLSEIIAGSKLKVYELIPILTSLEIKGLIIKSGANLYKIK